MKTVAFALLALSTLLFALSTKLPSASAETVLDSKGDPVLPGKRYYIVSAFWGAGGGGLYYGETGDSTCPVSVLQYGWDTLYGKPVVFKPLETGILNITTGTPLEISFADKIDCAESSKWIVVDKLVAIGGAQDHPNQELLSGEFMIQKQRSEDSWYDFLFITTGDETTVRVAYPVGRAFDSGARRLGLTGFSFPFVIKKYDDPNHLSSII